MNWVVFGDDWGAHPSTTQHLILNLPADDSVIWIDSIGMRSPALRVADARRLLGKAKALLRPAPTTGSGLYQGTVGSIEHIRPAILPWHRSGTAARFNSVMLARALQARTAASGARPPVVLSSNPVAVQYLRAVPHGPVVYLRLDDYEHYPGCDPELVRSSERTMYEAADVIVATARALLPSGAARAKSHYLPQGVEVHHFASVPLAPERSRVLGFFGAIANWLDFELIRQVSAELPEWQLEFVGRVEYCPDDVRGLPNVTFRPAVPFSRLPEVMSGWTAAWIPFLLNELTLSVNPLKLREYLAAGLPSQCTPLPEAEPLLPHVLLTRDPAAIRTWLEHVLESDTAEARRARRAAVSRDSWADRAAALRRIVGTAQGAARP